MVDKGKNFLLIDQKQAGKSVLIDIILKIFSVKPESIPWLLRQPQRGFMLKPGLS